MISLLITSGHSDAAVVLRSGHRDSNSLQKNHNLTGRNGEAQLAAVFGRAHEVSKQNPAEISAHNMKRAMAAKLEPTQKMAGMHGDTQTETPQTTARVLEVEEKAVGAMELFGGKFIAANCTINVNVSTK